MEDTIVRFASGELSSASKRPFSQLQNCGMKTILGGLPIGLRQPVNPDPLQKVQSICAPIFPRRHLRRVDTNGALRP